MLRAMPYMLPMLCGCEVWCSARGCVAARGGRGGVATPELLRGLCVPSVSPLSAWSRGACREGGVPSAASSLAPEARSMRKVCTTLSTCHHHAATRRGHVLPVHAPALLGISMQRSGAVATAWRQQVACRAASRLQSRSSRVCVCRVTCRASSSGSGRLGLEGRQPRISSLYSEVPDTSTRNPSTCRQQ